MKRSKFDICVEVLICCNEKIGITNIMYSAKVSYVTAKESVDELIKRGMIEKSSRKVPLSRGRRARLLSENPKSRVKDYYEITERGRLFLDRVEGMQRVWEGSV